MNTTNEEIIAVVAVGVALYASEMITGVFTKGSKNEGKWKAVATAGVTALAYSQLPKGTYQKAVLFGGGATAIQQLLSS